MNTSLPISVGKTRYSNPFSRLEPETTSHDLLYLVVTFVLASATASLLRSKHATYYGVFCASAGIWRLSIAVVSTTIFASLTLVVSSFSHQLHLNITSKGTSSHTAVNHESASSIQHNSQQGYPDQKDTAPEDVPTHLHHFQPLFFRARTTHRRFYPKVHAFDYSYLLVGIPVLDTPMKVNSMLSSHLSPPSQYHGRLGHSETTTKSAWFSVHASDYLQRGSIYQDLTLRAKLEIYLTSQGVSTPKDTFPYAYLVTAPKFLGFSFNPVSFWYLYDREQKLKAMILEVNNTFDERRMYFLPGDFHDTRSTNDGEISQSGDNQVKSVSTRFTNKWRKDFHVSPFNDRGGTYSVSAVDILKTGCLDVTIVLSEDHNDLNGNFNEKDGTTTETSESTPTTTNAPFQSTSTKTTPKLIARIYNPPTEPPINPHQLTLLQNLLFTLSHGFTGFLTNPRILFEARKLWVMGLMVFYRPEPFNTTVPRVESEEEIVVEEGFRKVLGGLSDGAVTIGYVSAAGEGRGVEVEIRSGGDGVDTKTKGEIPSPTLPHLKTHVLTPTFYTELAKAPADLQGVFDRFGVNAPCNERMVHYSSVDLLRRLLVGEFAEEAKTKARVKEIGSGLNGDSDQIYNPPESTSALERWTTIVSQWMVHRLRRRVSPSPIPPVPLLSSPSAQDTQPTPTSTSIPTQPRSHSHSRSQLDHLIRIHTTSPAQYTTYLVSALTILLADRFALGSIGLLRFQIRLLRGLVVWMVVKMGMWGVEWVW